ALRPSGRGRRLAGRSLPYRRQADLVARGHALHGLHAATVHAHLAGPEQTVNMAARDALEVSHEEVVQALAFVLRAGFDHPGARRGSMRVGVLHLLIDSNTWH